MKYNNEISLVRTKQIFFVFQQFCLLLKFFSVKTLWGYFPEKKMASNYSQDQYYGEYLIYIESFTRLCNEVPPSFQNDLAHQKQEAMTVKEYQQTEASPSTSEASSTNQTDVLVKL